MDIRLAGIAFAAFALGGLTTALALESSTAVVVTPVLKAAQTWSGQPLAYPDGAPEVSVLRVEIAPGGETGWHLHPVPSFGLLLGGTLEVALKDGRVKRLEAGDALAEVVDTLHNGRNVGKDPVQLVVFYAGAQGVPLSVNETDAKRP